MMLKSLLRHVLTSLVLPIILIVGIPVFMFTTHPGLCMTLAIAKIALPGQLTITDIDGCLMHGFSVKNLRYHYQGEVVRIKKLLIGLQWNWSDDLPLLKSDIQIQNLLVKHTDNILHLAFFQADLYGNSPQSFSLKSHFTGRFKQLAGQGTLLWKNNKLNLDLNAGANTLRLTGDPGKMFYLQATIKQPALLASVLKDLQTQIQLKGTYSPPNQTGHLSIHLSEGHLQLPNTSPLPRIIFHRAHFLTDLKKENIQTTGHINLEDKRNLHLDFLLSDYKNWRGSVALTQQKNALILQGKGSISPELSGKLTLQGTDFQLVKNLEYSIATSPSLKATFNQSTINIEGNILIPRALIKPLSFDNSLSLSQDAVFVHKRSQQNTTFQIHTSIDLELGKEVFLEYSGLMSQLSGKVHLAQNGTSPWSAYGQLILKKGKYRAYGQDLKIKEGQLLFTGGSPTNPGINVHATRKFHTNTIPDAVFNNDSLQNVALGNDTTVGVSVSGFLQDPRIRLYSNPATLSEADILSLLLLGKSFSQVEMGGEKLVQEQLIIAAMASIQNSKSTALIEQMKKKLAIDLSVKTAGEFDQKTSTVKSNPTVVMGKAISKNLYVRYNASLSKAGENLLTLEWLLNRFFSVQVSSSKEGSGIDLLYSSKEHKSFASKK